MLYLVIIILALDTILMYSKFKDEKNTNELLKKTINNLEDDLDLANSRVENRDNLIKDLQEEHVILLENASENRSKIIDLENNIELLTNNLSDENKELVSKLATEN